MNKSPKKSKTAKSKLNDGLPPSPGHLREDGRRLWSLLQAQFHIPPDMLVLLEMICESFDRMHDARREIVRTGMVTTDRFGQQKVAPSVLIERDSRSLCAKLLKQLGVGSMADVAGAAK